jgi:hypothetical protein
MPSAAFPATLPTPPREIEAPVPVAVVDTLPFVWAAADASRGIAGQAVDAFRDAPDPMPLARSFGVTAPAPASANVPPADAGIVGLTIHPRTPAVAPGTPAAVITGDGTPASRPAPAATGAGENRETRRHRSHCHAGDTAGRRGKSRRRFGHRCRSGVARGRVSRARTRRRRENGDGDDLQRRPRFRSADDATHTDTGAPDNAVPERAHRGWACDTAAVSMAAWRPENG